MHLIDLKHDLAASNLTEYTIRLYVMRKTVKKNMLFQQVREKKRREENEQKRI